MNITATALDGTGEASFRIIGPYLTPNETQVLWLIYAIQNEVKGEDPSFAVAEINMEKFIHTSLIENSLGTSTDLFLLNQDGDILVSNSHPEMFMSNISHPEEGCFECHENFDLPQRVLTMPEGWGKWANTEHDEVYAFSSFDFGNNIWSVILGFPEYSLANLIGRFQHHFYIVLALTFSILGLLASVLIDIRRKKIKAEERTSYLQQRASFQRDRREMNRRYTDLVEQANDAIYIKHIDRFVLVNRAWEELSGYSREELLSPDFDILSLISPEERDYIRERGERHAMGRPMEPTYEFTLIRKDGKEVEVEVNVTYIQYDGKPAVQGVIRDISERKRAEEQKELMLSLTNTIRESSDLHELAKNALACVTKILDMSTGALYIHDEQKNELQLVAHEGIWEGILSIQENYNMNKGEKGIAVKTALQQDIIIVEDMAASPLLSYIPDRSSLKGKSLISIPLNSQDILLGVLQLAQDTLHANWSYDLTYLKQIANAIAIGLHRRKISSELAESERRLKHLFENSTEVIYSTTPEGKLKEVNKAGINLFSGSHDEKLAGIDITKLRRSKLQWSRYVEKIEMDGFIKDMEVEYLCQDGEVHDFLESIIAMRDERGKIMEFQGIMRDITSLKKVEEEMILKNAELERVNTELRELDLMKDNFIATISHELRTPLTSIKGSIDLLLKGMAGKLDKKKEEILNICNRNSERLITLVNDLLEIQHLESGRTELKLQPIEIEDLIPEVMERANNDTGKKDVHLIARIDKEDHGKIIMADQSKISHAMFNLLTNAIKFSDKGTVVVEVAYHNGEVHLSVTDEGAGIPREMREKIFDKFTQGDGSMTREQGGTGLGLAITRTIVEKHGGRIWVESEEGTGSKFTFSLPCYPKKERDEQLGEQAGGKVDE